MPGDSEDHVDWAASLRRAARTGEPINLAKSVDDDHVRPAESETWDAGRRVPADAVREALLDHALKPDPQGLQLRGVVITGTLNLDYATVPCRLKITQSHFENPPSFNHATLVELCLDGCSLTGLVLEGATVTGDVVLKMLQSSGEVRAIGAKIGGRLSLSRSVLYNDGGDALSLDEAKIDGDAFLNELDVRGEVRVLGAVIGGQLNMTRSVLHNDGGDALTLDEARITGDAVLEKVQASGKVSGFGTHVGGQLNLSRVALHNDGGDALILDEANITGDAFLDELNATGKVRALDATIGGQLNMGHAVLNDGDGEALNLDEIHISGDAVLESLRAIGKVHAIDAVIGGQLDLTGAALDHRGKDALVMHGATVTGNTYLDDLDVTGAIRVLGATFKAKLSLGGDVRTNPGDDAVALQAVTVERLELTKPLRLVGMLNLARAEIHHLDVGPARTGGLPPLSNAQGWSLGTLEGFFLTERHSVYNWLMSIPLTSSNNPRRIFVTQPWQEMARVFAQSGHPEEARWLRYKAAQQVTKSATVLWKPVRLMYGGFVGYGYRSYYVVPWLIGLFLVSWALAGVNAAAFSPSDTTVATTTATVAGVQQTVPVTGATRPAVTGYAQFSPVLFAVDTAIPAATTGQSAAWVVISATWLSVTFAAFRVFAWILTALLLGGVTGILRQD